MSHWKFACSFTVFPRRTYSLYRRHLQNVATDIATPRKITQLNARKNSTITSPPDKVTSEVITVSKEDLEPKNVPLKCKEELPTASEVSLDREEVVKTLGVFWNPGSDAINFEVKRRRSSALNERYLTL